MAAEESVNRSLIDVEPVINRWIVDYYLSLALEFYKNEQYADFCAISDTINCVLERHLENTNGLSLKIRFLQFLSRIYEAGKPDQSLESDQTTTPLESALLLLEMMTKEFEMPQHAYESVFMSLKEMIVGTLIKNSQFDKAKTAFIQYFPKSVCGKSATFLNLISRKSKAHKVIEEINFQSFKEEMLEFCLRFCPFAVPFLCKAAQSLVEKRLEEPEDEAVETNEEDHCGSSCSLQVNTIQFCKNSIIQRIRLEVAYNALAEDEKTFTQLEEEVEMEAQEKEREDLFQSNTSGLTKDLPANHLPQQNAEPPAPKGSFSRYTVSRLVTEPDSQSSSQFTTAEEDLEPEVRTEKPPQTRTVSTEADLLDTQCPVTDKQITIPTRKRRRQTNNAACSLVESSADDDGESLDSVGNKKTNAVDLHDQTEPLLNGNSNKPKQSSSETRKEDPVQFKTPEKRPPQPPSACPLSNDPDDEDDISISDSSLDSLPTVSTRHPRTRSSTPDKVAQVRDAPLLKWKELVKEAEETKDTWSDEEQHFPSTNARSNRRTSSNSEARRQWTTSETEKLKEGVKKFGEGNWRKIKAYYSFENRTNVNLKDRWRTMKKLKMV